MDVPTLRLQSDSTHNAAPLSLRIGFDMHFEFAAPTPLVLMLYCHPDASGTVDGPENLRLDPNLPVEVFTDPLGNRCARLTAPVGMLRVSHDTTFATTYQEEPQPVFGTRQHRVDELPTDVLPYLLGSRYVEVDRVGAVAWDLFGKLTPGGERALAINKWVFENIHFSYKLTRSNKTALDTLVERNGVCRDMMHLAIGFCRAMNIPARYATGYLGDIDADPDPTPMDFSAFYEVYLDGKWWPMDARHGKPRVGRVLMARGRDAADCALITSFGRHRLARFTVITDEITSPPPRKIEPQREPLAMALSA